MYFEIFNIASISVFALSVCQNGVHNNIADYKLQGLREGPISIP
jgi:hypothetical protein